MFFKEILSHNLTANKTLLAGDYNINHLNFQINEIVQYFVNLIFDFNMMPTTIPQPKITFPSYIC